MAIRKVILKLKLLTINENFIANSFFIFLNKIRDLVVSLKKQIIRASIYKAILTIIFAIALILLRTTDSKAVLQANPTTHKSPTTKNGATWITQIRQMETVNQTMGLKETLNGLNATSASNGIDVHMMLPTEYGAVAILSASGYGNPRKLRDTADAQKRTTTGNSTGVYFTGDRWEIVSASGTLSGSKYHMNPINPTNCLTNTNQFLNDGRYNENYGFWWGTKWALNGPWIPDSIHVDGTGIFSTKITSKCWRDETNVKGKTSSWENKIVTRYGSEGQFPPKGAPGLTVSRGCAIPL